MEKSLSSSATQPVQHPTKSRLRYVDNLRILLIALVVLHHLIITYGAPGGWYYREHEADGWYAIPFTMFVATNQAFFMGLFFFIAAYFTPRSYDRKGARPFLRDRLRRLGVPLLVYFFVLSPILIYFLRRYLHDMTLSFPAFLIEHQGFSFGPMWFVETLLYFSLFYVGYRLVGRSASSTPKRKRPLPSDGSILLFALGIGLISFVIRIWLPVGWALEPLGLQFPHFAQYIALMVLGVVAYRYGWLTHITYRRGLRWFIFAQVCIFLFFPALFLLGGAASGHIEAFTGGWHWQSLAYAIWEQVVGFSLIVGLLGIFREKWDLQASLAKKLSASAYTVYIIHPLVLIFLSLSFRPLDIYPPVKFLLLAPVALVFCFVLANLIRQAPYARKIL